jgi:LEA14-like dessication related protein
MLAAATLVAVAVGCRSGGGTAAPPIPFDQPEVALRDVRLRGVGLLGGALDVEMRVYNPNGYDLAAPRVDYRIYVQDVQVATGMTDLSVVVPSRDSAVVRLPASFSYAALGSAGRRLLNAGAAPYRVLGRITVGTPYGRLSFPYDRVGNFSTLNVPVR